jgi:hypothetical protein
VTLGPDQPLQTVFLGKSVCHALAMLSGPAGEVTGDTNVKSAIGPIGNHVDPST